MDKSKQAQQMNSDQQKAKEAYAPLDFSNPELAKLRDREPFFRANPLREPVAAFLADLPFSANDIAEARARWKRCAPLLATLFPELTETEGVIESPLIEAPGLAEKLLGGNGRLLIKADHALPVAGSIKARGGIYAVLHFAERVALENGLLEGLDDDYRKLAEPAARELFGRYTLSTGSTGNLGLSIGIAGSALGFDVAVHMSMEAREWKKERLRKRGVRVVEYDSDYTAACVVARAEAAADPMQFFVDDENSVELFMGYACAVEHLRLQLDELGLSIGADRPLFLYLPCGVGGGPGGIAFAARHVFGDAAHPIFVEPVDAPCMVLGMLTGRHSDISIYDLGLTLETDADGLAVSTPSRFIGQLMEPILSGCSTLEDETMHRDMLRLYEVEGIEVEPSAAAGFGAAPQLLESREGREFLAAQGMDGAVMARAVHLVWTTGGSFVPAEQHRLYRAHARGLA